MLPTGSCSLVQQSPCFIHQIKPDCLGIKWLKGFYDPSIYDWKKGVFTFDTNFGTQCRSSQNIFTRTGFEEHNFLLLSQPTDLSPTYCWSADGISEIGHFPKSPIQWNFHPTCLYNTSFSFLAKADEAKEDGGGGTIMHFYGPFLPRRRAADCLQSVHQSSWGASIYDVHTKDKKELKLAD